MRHVRRAKPIFARRSSSTSANRWRGVERSSVDLGGSSSADTAVADQTDEARVRRAAHARALVLLLLEAARCRRARALRRSTFARRFRREERASFGQWRRIVTALEEAGAGKASWRARRTALSASSLSRLLTRRGLIVLISRSALMDQPEVEAAMRSLRAAGHDVTVLHIMDPAERDFVAVSSGEALFSDSESDLAIPAQRVGRPCRVPQHGGGSDRGMAVDVRIARHRV